MRIKSSRVRKVRLSDFASFSDDDDDLDLVDIVNDVTREAHENEFIKTPGAFVYELDLAIDTQKTYVLGIEGLSVEFYKKHPSLRRPRHRNASRRAQDRSLSVQHEGSGEAEAHFDEGVSMKSARKNRRLRAKRRRSEMRKFLNDRERPFFTVTIDLGVNAANPSFQYSNVPDAWAPKAKIHSVFLAARPEVVGKLKPAVISASPLYNAPRLSIAGSAKGFMKNNIKMHRDPLNMLAAPTPMYPTLSAKVDFGSRSLSSGPILKEADLIALDSIRVRRSLVETREGLETQEQDDSDSATRLAALVSNDVNLSVGDRQTLGYKASVQNFKKRIRRRIELDKRIVGWREKFYVRVTPIVKSRQSKIRTRTKALPKTFSVSHRDKVKELIDPQIAPELSLVRNSRGNIVLRVKQVDPMGRNIKIIRRIFSIRSRPWFSTPEVVSSIRTPPGSTSEIVTDTGVANITPNVIIYRAVIEGPAGQLGPSKGLIVRGIDPIVPPPPEDPNVLAIVAKNEAERVKIEVGNIPEEVISLRLLREDLSRLGEFSDRVTVIPDDNNKTMVLEPAGEDLTFYDYNTIPGGKYRYFAAMRAGIGSEFLSEEDESFIRVIPTKPLPVEVSIENPQISSDQYGNLIFELDLVSTPKNDNIDFVLRLLKKSGVSTVFLEEIDKQRSDFADVAVFVVERVDRVTGKRVSFGLHPAGTFSDNPGTRARLGLPALLPGSRYTYYAKLCIRPPESLLRNVFAKFSSPSTPGVDNKEALAQKFQSVFAGQFGNSPGGALPSTSDLIKGVGVGENLKAGETGIVLETELRTPESKPDPIKLHGHRNRKRGWVYLSWSASEGDMSHVDHCLIFVTINNRKICLGTVASDGEKRRFFFRDRFYGSQPGKLVYTIKFVYRDLSISSESNIFGVYNSSYTPSNLLGGTFLGVAR